jgi:hypothetical protein
MSRTLQGKRILKAGSQDTTAGGSGDFINSYSSQCRQAAREKRSAAFQTFDADVSF